MIGRMTLALGALCLVVGLTGCASPASSVVVGKARPAIPVDQVKLYLSAPKKFEEIALLQSSSMYSWAVTEQGKMDAVIATMKAEAAKIGANGILLQSAGTQQAGSVSAGSGTATRVGNTAFGSGTALAVPIMFKAGSGVAIFVTEE
jgi:hypothetical protein